MMSNLFHAPYASMNSTISRAFKIAKQVALHALVYCHRQLTVTVQYLIVTDIINAISSMMKRCAIVREKGSD